MKELFIFKTEFHYWNGQHEYNQYKCITFEQYKELYLEFLERVLNNAELYSYSCSLYRKEIK